MSGRTIALAAVGLAVCFTVVAAEIPLSNWTVPAYRSSGASGGLTTMADVTPGIGFVGVAPCRLVDTRQAGFPAGYGPPSLTQGAPRNFDLNSDSQCTGIPTGVDAYSLNITVTNTQGPGFILIYPQGGSQPTVSTVNYVAGQTIANAAIVPAGTNGGVTVIAGVSGTDLIIDINGYFTDQYNPGVSFHAVSGTAAPAILGENTSTAVGAAAVKGVITSTAPASSSAAVRGINNSTTDSGIGIWGSHSGSGIGVVGEAQLDGIGVQGTVLGGSLISFGVEGLTASNHVGSAGVLGVQGSILPSPGTSPAGVRGESQSHTGLLGLTQSGVAVTGARVDAQGYAIAYGSLGVNAGAVSYGVESYGNALVQGDLSVTGTKSFIQPHPLDASKEIRYVALEGPQSEVYFRGTAQIARGITRVEVPADFRLVADPGTYSTLVTPVDQMATVAVVMESPDGIVLKASRDVKVHYVVYAEREAVKNPDPVVENVDFRPDPQHDLFRHLPESYRQMLIQNHTLNPDGTVNLETARRLGWDKQWEKSIPQTRPAD